MGKGSGIDSVKAWLNQMNIEASDEEALKITAAVKNHSLSTKQLLTEVEFRMVVESVVGQREASHT